MHVYMRSGPDVVETLPLDPQSVDSLVHAASANAANADAALAQAAAEEAVITMQEAQDLFDSRPTFLYARTLSLSSIWALDSAEHDKVHEEEASHKVWGVVGDVTARHHVLHNLFNLFYLHHYLLTGS